MSTTRNGEQGIALVFVLFLMAALSAMAVSMMFLAQTETSASRNYRTMSQARYGGEAGIHKAINYMLNSYPAPTSTAGYVTTVSPVTYNGNPVILSATAGVASNYPDNAVITAFDAAAAGTLATNTSGVTNNAALPTVNYTAYAKLISMRAVNVYGGGTGVIQTWQITAQGTVPGSIPATVEVTALLERDLVDAQTFAVFATGTGCGAIDLQGTVATGSFDSSAGSTVSNSGGNVGTNGNLAIGGHVDVHGSLSTPRTGIGACTTGNVTALTQSGAATVDGNDLIQLPQALSFADPVMPAPVPVTSSYVGCAQVTIQAPALCSVSGGVTTIDPNGLPVVKLGNISGNFVLKGGKYMINSIGSGNLSVEPSPSGTQNVEIYLSGKTTTGTDLANPFNLNGQAVVNTSMDPQRLQLLYAGSGTIDLTGGSNASMLLYAPKATVQTHGNADIWGSILSRQVTSAGTPRFLYDRRLSSTFQTMGNYVMSSFSWKKY